MLRLRITVSFLVKILREGDKDLQNPWFTGKEISFIIFVSVFHVNLAFFAFGEWQNFCRAVSMIC